MTMATRQSAQIAVDKTPGILDRNSKEKTVWYIDTFLLSVHVQLSVSLHLVSILADHRY